MVDECLLRSFEQDIIAFITGSFQKEEGYEWDMSNDVDALLDLSDEEGWISLEPNFGSKQLQIKLVNSFLRLLVHSMCRYYCLASYSR